MKGIVEVVVWRVVVMVRVVVVRQWCSVCVVVEVVTVVEGARREEQAIERVGAGQVALLRRNRIGVRIALAWSC